MAAEEYPKKGMIFILVHGILAMVMYGAAIGRALDMNREQFGKPVSGSVPTIVRSFKSAVTKRINSIRRTPGAKLWQRNYWEHIIRNESELNRIREYIRNNPTKWESDELNGRAKETGRSLLPASEIEVWMV